MRPARFLRFFRHLNHRTLGRAISRAFKRRLIGLSAEIAYNAMLALFPAILAILTAVGMFEDSVRATLTSLAIQFKDIAPEQVWELLNEFVSGTKIPQGRGLFSLSFVAAIWIFSGAVSAAMNALDQIHQIPREHRRPIWKAKLISLMLTVGTIVLLLSASFLVLLSDWVIQLTVTRTGASVLLTFWRLLSWPVGLSIVAIAFAFIYRFGPSLWVRSTPIVPGAILAALSWAGVSALFKLYVSNFGNYNKIYGTIGAVIVLMLWLYMSALVMLMGYQTNATVGEAMRMKSKTRRVAGEVEASFKAVDGKKEPTVDLPPKPSPKESNSEG